MSHKFVQRLQWTAAGRPNISENMLHACLRELRVSGVEKYGDRGQARKQTAFGPSVLLSSTRITVVSHCL